VLNGGTPNPHMQYRCATATVQTPITQDIVKTKTKQNAQTVTEAHTRHRREMTALNTGDRRKGLNSCRNNYTLDYINGNNS